MICLPSCGINTNALNIFTLSLRATEKSVAISYLMRLPRRSAPRNDSVGLCSLLREEREISCVPRNDILLNAFVLATSDLKIKNSRKGEYKYGKKSRFQLAYTD